MVQLFCGCLQKVVPCGRFGHTNDQPLRTTSTSWVAYPKLNWHEILFTNGRGSQGQDSGSGYVLEPSGLSSSNHRDLAQLCTQQTTTFRFRLVRTPGLALGVGAGLWTFKGNKKGKGHHWVSGCLGVWRTGPRTCRIPSASTHRRIEPSTHRAFHASSLEPLGTFSRSEFSNETSCAPSPETASHASGGETGPMENLEKMVRSCGK